MREHRRRTSHRNYNKAPQRVAYSLIERQANRLTTLRIYPPPGSFLFPEKKFSLARIPTKACFVNRALESSSTTSLEPNGAEGKTNGNRPCNAVQLRQN
jgi:hypothetical protein